MAVKTQTVQTLTLPAVLDLNAASALKTQLLALRGSPVTIDAGQVDRLGTLCLQVLVSAGRTWEADNLPYTYENASDAFAKTTALLGVSVEQRHGEH
ncbi:STAS domain-containing protein [Rhizobium sp. CFBP 8762]|uniref:STAS domain-containing protein n=1 Tax=Rhizobium sp. CFBP 8762 TaxID=2775279 RepID=UPI00177B6A87|nr:STAS domain-containing protein [Rhizobium sp. CFBP 8762]MBD8553490.1 STAS domain-containing protein [Rhizobium sp. CFBP 8762]